MKKKFLFLLLLIFNSIFSQNQLPIIPYPSQVELGSGSFVFSDKTTIQASENSFEAKYLKEIIKSKSGLDLSISEVYGSNSIQLLMKLPDTINFDKEHYELNVSNSKITITAFSNQGLFYGIQTLLQLIPSDEKNKISIPCLQINDYSKYKWRGMHLDVSRHFFPKEFIKKYIDYVARYKMNVFHWHLTDDQGWRIEIKKYPKLTEVGAWRKGSMIGHYREQKFDNKPYGGFYTQEEIKEIVAYATERHITVVPEIEMPGHALAALASYPQYSCTGGPFEVALKWGVLDDVFCPKEETFEFLENILSEVIALFPSDYIHIGGDECPKTRWKKCANCQSVIKREGLKDEHELQSYFIRRIEKFVNSKGRKIMGWDEILEGGLAPNAAVMSWRGTKGGIEAAKQNHFVVMTPGSHCYFDHYQGEPKNEPLAIGGFTTVEKVYGFNPTPTSLSKNEAKYILGVQGNVWTEYMEDANKVEYMIFPRMLALSEVLWGTSNTEKYKEFQDRMIQHFQYFEENKINYSKAIFELTSKIGQSDIDKSILFSIKSSKNQEGIRYTTDGSNPSLNSNRYENPIVITESQTVKAAYFENGQQKSATIEQSFSINKATGKKISLLNQPSESYAANGAFTLVDGVIGDRQKFGRDWLGFSGKDMVAIIDLGKVVVINKISISSLANEGSWIYFPKNIEFLLSNDGVNFKSVQSISAKEILEKKGEISIELKSEKAKFIKVIASNLGKIPEGNPGAGSNAWLFIDEIGVE
ncbi:family 20 glycosylhydrolase [Flavobacterium sp.]|uniref:glycoside hydrolase family 20 protein n=1 Tax=Flavobacterium sp. TaxID=239 RepID=UPI002624040B|nr:family 20 glycosylhydrolase [Flavobacterium sp.]